MNKEKGVAQWLHTIMCSACCALTAVDAMKKLHSGNAAVEFPFWFSNFTSFGMALFSYCHEF
jgi:hypothetical protein